MMQLYLLKSFANNKNNTPTKNIAVTMTISIQRGEVTHHHDQSITPTNFKIKNTMKTVPDNPDLCDVLFDIVVVVLIINT
jgi:hypothetical protein